MPKPTKCPNCDHTFDDGVSQATGEQIVVSSVNLGDTSDSMSHQARRGRRVFNVRFVRWSVVAALFVICAILISVVATYDPAARLAEKKTTQDAKRNSAAEPKSPRPASPRSTQPDRSKLLAAIEDSIVQIKSGGPAAANSLGSGFIVESSGLVATNYHVVCDATMGTVQFKNGTTYEIEGYVAVEPENDLAILKLRDAPANLSSLTLRIDDEPDALTEVVAIGHPHGLSFSPYDGKVSRIVNTSQLPDRSQRFLEGHMNSPRDHRWIQHTVVLSEGNSGGPLLNANGEVVGINTWVDKQTQYGYALGATHLRDLLERPLAKIAPLEEYATKEARESARKQRLTAERLRELYKLAKAMNWTPQSDEDYHVLQQLAWLITIARFPGSFGGGESLDESLLEAIIKEADQIEASLQKDKLQAFERITIINDFAAARITRASAGVFFFATVQRIVAGHDGSRGMIARFPGSNQTVFVPLDGLLFEPVPESYVMILGINHNGRFVQYGDNPLQLTSAPVIVSRTILTLNE